MIEKYMTLHYRTVLWSTRQYSIGCYEINISSEYVVYLHSCYQSIKKIKIKAKYIRYKWKPFQRILWGIGTSWASRLQRRHPANTICQKAHYTHVTMPKYPKNPIPFPPGDKMSLAKIHGRLHHNHSVMQHMQGIKPNWTIISNLVPLSQIWHPSLQVVDKMSGYIFVENMQKHAKQ